MRFTTRIAEWDGSLSGFERRLEREDRCKKRLFADLAHR